MGGSIDGRRCTAELHRARALVVEPREHDGFILTSVTRDSTRCFAIIAGEDDELERYADFRAERCGPDACRSAAFGSISSELQNRRLIARIGFTFDRIDFPALPETAGNREGLPAIDQRPNDFPFTEICWDFKAEHAPVAARHEVRGLGSVEGTRLDCIRRAECDVQLFVGV